MPLLIAHLIMEPSVRGCECESPKEGSGAEVHAPL